MQTSKLVLAMLGALPAVALSTTCPAQEQGGHHSGAFEPGHVLGLFLGETSEDRRGSFTLGLEYEYRISPELGLGLTAEHIGGDFDTNVFVVPIARHYGPWKVYAGPGVERRDGENEGLLRVGVEYGFHFGDYEISPQIDFDWVDGERLFVVGVVFAREF
ncbi:MAG: hypothetical protein AAFY29_02680 [Pseudomonadota bacterium]